MTLRSKPAKLLSLINYIMLFALILVGCGEESNGNNSIGSASRPTDPYTNLQPRQVMEIYLKAYQSQDWKTCKALLASSVYFKSPDEFELIAQSQRKKYGTIENVFISDQSDLGSTFHFWVSVKYSKEEKELGANSPFEINRINNSWKIESFPYL